ncbi:adhesin [Streptomyces sp. NPDC023998]|uniref:adhesin n=1 Tax=Streptomyces sp. NPDC023998 TaxID=3154597 RepID=UPI0033E992C2
MLAGWVVLAVLALVVSAITLFGGESSSANASDDPGSDFDPGDLGGPPRRIAPTEEPGTSPSDSSATPSPSGSGPGKPGTPKPPQSRPPYSAWAGPGCTGGGLYRETGRFSDGFDGWYTVSTGGHKGDGCDGSFTAVPMSGSATKDGNGRATWSWYVGSGYTTCSVAVVIPKTPRDQDVAGDPTTYHVLADPDDEDSTIRSFEIDQTSLRGRGLTLAKIPVRNQQLAVQLVDRGKDFGGDREGAHHAAAQMRAECTP